MTWSVLLLGGTAEAREFAERFQHPNLKLIASLAGVTRDPKPYPCDTRVGGFGGVEAMAEWIEQNRIAAIIDATHPFATQISVNAHKAADQTGILCLALHRAQWEPEGKWREFEDARSLAAELPTKSRVFLTTGRGELETFSARTDVGFTLRSIEPITDLPNNIKDTVARPPFSLEGEIATLEEACITHLVTKNAGGARPAKLKAAHTLGIEIFSLAMPPTPHRLTAGLVTEALNWLDRFRL